MADDTTQTTQTQNGGEQTTEQTQQTTETAEQTQQTTETTEQTTEQTTKAEDGAPEKYEFKPLEGQEFDPEFIKVYSEVSRELNLSQEKAQTLIDKISPVIEQRQAAKLEEVRNGWTEASKVDAEFGGAKLEENLGIAKAALDKFGSPELKDLINASGLGNHPEIIRFFYRTGKAISADTFVGGHKEGGSSPKNFNEMADKLYAK